MRALPVPAPAPLLRLADLSPATRGLALGLAAAAIWGTYLAMGRAGISAGLHAADIAFLRYAVAGLVLAPWLLAHDPVRLAGIGWRRGGLLALLVGPPFILVGVGGYAYAPLAHGAVLQPAALTIGGLLLAKVVLKDRPSPERIAGVGVILAGLVLIAGHGFWTGGPQTVLGDLMFVGGGLMWAGFTVLQKRWALAPLQATAAVSVLSGLFYAPLYLALVGMDRIIALPWPMLLGQVLVQGLLSGVVAVIAFSRAVQILGAGKAAIFPALVPAVAILVGIPVAGEWPTELQLLGLGLITTGLFVALGLLKGASAARLASAVRRDRRRLPHIRDPLPAARREG
jgi:drug/metabolite transporter (DMT)-like permease